MDVRVHQGGVESGVGLLLLHLVLVPDEVGAELGAVQIVLLTLVVEPHLLGIHAILPSLTFSKVTSKAKWMLQTEEKLGYISTTSNFAQFPCGFQKSELYTGFFPEHRCLVSFTSLDARW